MRTTAEALDYLKKNFKPRKFNLPINSYFMKWQEELDREVEEQSNKIYSILGKIIESNEIHTVGKGRSGFIVGCTGTRLMHLGYNVYDRSDPYAPAMRFEEERRPLLLAYSGSGMTKFVVTAAKKAKERDVPIVGVSSNLKSDLVNIAGEENIIITKGKKIYPTKSIVIPESEEPINFLQTKSEFKALCVGELLVNELAKIKGATEADMKRRHNDTE